MADSSTAVSSPIARLARELEAIAGQGMSERAFVRAAEPAMQRLLGEKDFLPEEAMQPSESGYARHLLYSDPQGRFSIAAMVWQSGQGTPVHDHDGTWGMIGMIQGGLEIVNYFSDEEGLLPGEVLLRSESPHTPQAGTDQCICGCADIHAVNNRLGETAISVHVYARDLEKCLVFEPVPGKDGQFTARKKTLSYTSGTSS
jgi:predicted metal-dependent enzyme (double-stranded beta helix superfamily)